MLMTFDRSMTIESKAVEVRPESSRDEIFLCFVRQFLALHRRPMLNVTVPVPVQYRVPVLRTILEEKSKGG